MSSTADLPGGLQPARPRLSGMKRTGPDDGYDAARFAALYARYREDLYRFCQARVGNQANVEDLVQDVFERAFTARARFDSEKEFWPWLASIAARGCIDSHRRRATAAAGYARFARATYREPLDETSAAVLRTIDQQRLAEQIATLPVRQQAALTLFAIDGWSYETIARHLGYSTTAVKALIQRARTRLRKTTARWVGAVIGTRRLVRDRLQERWAAVGSLPRALDLVGMAMTTRVPTLSVALVAAVAAGGLVDTGATHRPSLDAPLMALPAPAVVDRPDRPAAVRAPEARRPTPPRSLTVGGERMADAVVHAAVDDGSAVDEESVRATSFAVSPDYEKDPTVFVAGERAELDQWRPTPLLVSHDDGASWQPRRAVGLAPVTKLLLPPDYPADRRLLAVTVKGLQVSHDDGDTFETVVWLPDATDVAVSPASASDGRTVLLVAGGLLWRYAEETGALEQVVLAGTPAGHLVTSVGFADDGAVLLGSRFRELVNNTPAIHVNRCPSFGAIVAGAVRQLRCEGTRLNVSLAEDLMIRVSPDLRPGQMYVALDTQPLVSSDGGRSFQPARQHSVDSPDRYHLYDLAVGRFSWGELVVVAQQTSFVRNGHFAFGPPLARTTDGGRTWTPLSVPLRFEAANRVIVTPTGRIIAGSRFGGLACSLDLGDTWKRTCSGPA